ncbi:MULTISPECIES: efflux RND transporter periplasmic adaptor subunit [unclassified Variovorax]|uniref:efflux RND transporter periplasmic adaptor subunit n=1 Tax=unclassified Variovorax TaxID=663243 RepID=UPI00076C55A3|nr:MULTISPECIES: efflux RND transporter periplasmic adaptor subunit [unclassified Variovorax]KWT70859.1 Cobalt/zinc/cadmium efflux RND transporter, membrane fusion protein, CzcB family [Variovorax sp. WDL1]PNG49229.1 Cation efflux system protein CusB [Variovorax sp. B2]PNG49614.1 Cation efflux system protein CusB [Variovorax sp. B4]VTV18714.1 Cation efflux system protein CusB precursor [Variovorax sp. WDL1]
MKLKPLLIGSIAAGVLAAAGFGLYTLGMQRGMGLAGASAASGGAAPSPASAAPAAPANETGEDATRRHIATGLKAGDTDPANGKKILYYHDPMVPGNKFDKPAKSPFMDMMMSPVYAGGDGDQNNVTVSPRVQQNLGVRTALVSEGTLSPQVAAVGSIAFNERDQVIVQARATGYVERLHVRATLDRVAKGQPLAELYVPDWIAAQEEFLSVQRMRGTDLAPLVDGARQRMRQVGMSEGQIELVARSGRTQPRITLVAPIGGVITELTTREGMTVMPGATLFRINGLSTVWANAEVPESQAALLRPGAKVRAKSPAAPGETFDGKVQAILPDVNPATRTLKARLELANPGARLVPGMFVSMQFMDMRADKVLLIPTEAVIQTGKRTVVMLAEENGRFSPVDVEIGIESGGQTEVKRGLQAGQRVVVSSQFLIDSEASLKGVEARLNSVPASGATPSSASATSAPKHVGEGKVESLSKDAMTLSHGPIPTMKWGPMTMDFKLPTGGAPRNVQNGDRVTFEFFMDKDDLPQLTRVTPMAPGPKAAAPAATGSKQ